MYEISEGLGARDTSAAADDKVLGLVCQDEIIGLLCLLIREPLEDNAVVLKLVLRYVIELKVQDIGMFLFKPMLGIIFMQVFFNGIFRPYDINESQIAELLAFHIIVIYA